MDRIIGRFFFCCRYHFFLFADVLVCACTSISLDYNLGGGLNEAYICLINYRKYEE